MAAYFVVQIEVTDSEAFERYREQVPATIAAHGGEYIVRGGDMEVMEGEWPWPRCVIVKFPDMESARAWHASEAYAGPKALRLSASKGNAILVEGV